MILKINKYVVLEICYKIKFVLDFMPQKYADDKNVSTSQKLSFELETQLNPEEWIIDPRPVTSSIKEFFKTSQLSQFMDQINPLAEMTHKRRISVFGPNGLKRDHISTIRDIHPSQYGRLYLLKMEGQNAGLITSMSLYARISSLGLLKLRISLKMKKCFLNKKQCFKS